MLASLAVAAGSAAAVANGATPFGLAGHRGQSVAYPGTYARGQAPAAAAQSSSSYA